MAAVFDADIRSHDSGRRLSYAGRPAFRHSVHRGQRRHFRSAGVLCLPISEGAAGSLLVALWLDTTSGRGSICLLVSHAMHRGMGATGRFDQRLSAGACRRSDDGACSVAGVEKAKARNPESGSVIHSGELGLAPAEPAGQRPSPQRFTKVPETATSNTSFQ